MNMSIMKYKFFCFSSLICHTNIEDKKYIEKDGKNYEKY